MSAWLRSHKTYPQAARERGEEGSAVVRFTVEHDGRVIAVDLMRGTGSDTLDAAVQELLRGARVPAFPPGMDLDRTTVTLQIKYSLEQ